MLIVVVALVVIVDCAGGIPLFQQDWAWPLTRAQALASLSDSFGVWHEGGLGYASGAPTAILDALILYSLCVALGPALALIAFITLVAVGSALGTRLLLQSYGAGNVGANLGAAAYVASPVLLNKFGAGHTYYLLSYAMLPLVCACIRKGAKSRRLILIGGAAGAIALGQFQFIILLPIAALLTAGPPWTPGRLRSLVVVLLLAIASHAPDYLIMSEAASSAATYPLFATQDWQRALSQPLLDAVAGFRYIGGFASHRLGDRLPLATDVAIGALVAAVGAAFASLRTIARGSEFTQRLSLILTGVSLVSVGALVSSGLAGPLAPALNYIFSATSLATAIREFYHFTVLLALGTALICAAAVGTRNGAIRLLGALAALTLICVDLSPYVRPVQAAAPSARSALIDSLNDGRKAFGRVLWLPGSPSLALPGAWSGGTDSFGPPDGPSASATYGSDPERLAFWFSQAPGSLVDVAPRLGVHVAIYRRSIENRYGEFLDPQTAKLLAVRKRAPPQPASPENPEIYEGAGQPTDLRAAQRARLARAGVPTWTNVLTLPREVHLLSPPPGPPAIAVKPYGFKTNPAEGWVQTQRWLPAMPEMSCLPQSSVMRWSAELPPASQCAWRYEHRNSLWCLALVQPGLTAYSSCSPRGIDDALVRQVDEINTGRQSLLWIRESFDDRWRLGCADGRSIKPNALVDAYANGWIVGQCVNPHTDFSPDRTFRATLGAVLALWLLMLVATAVLSLRRVPQS